MSLQLEEKAERLREVLNNPDVQFAMFERCQEENKHDYEGCYSASYQIYYKCKWCGTVRGS